MLSGTPSAQPRAKKRFMPPRGHFPLNILRPVVISGLLCKNLPYVNLEIHRVFQKVDAYAGDPILSLMERFKEDPRSDKVNLSIGLYYNDDGIIPQLQAVAEAEARLNAAAAWRLAVSADGRA